MKPRAYITADNDGGGVIVISVGVRKLRAALPYYLGKSTAGEVFGVTRHGKTVALLCPLATHSPMHGGGADAQVPEQDQGPQRQGTMADSRSKVIDDVQAYVQELEGMSREQLEQAFYNFFGTAAPEAMAESDILKAVARANQHELWLRYTGCVPADILRRDRQFWGRLVNSIEQRRQVEPLSGHS